MKQYFSFVQELDGKRHHLSPGSTIFPAWRFCHESELIMFLTFAAFVGLFGFAVMLGKLSAWFGILKLALLISLGAIFVLGIRLFFAKDEKL